MTLVLPMLSRRNVVVVSDRRAVSDGKLVDDDENKAITFECDDARLSVSFCGLARVGSFLTRRWLSDTLTNAAGPDYLAAPMIERLREAATLRFEKLPIRKKDKRLSIVLAGYVYDQDGAPSWHLWLVSNFETAPAPGTGFDDVPLTSLEEAAPEFTVTAYSDPHPGDVSHRAVGVFPIGAGALVPEANARTLIQLLAEEKPVDAIVNKAVATLRAVAADPKAADAVSADCMVVVLDPDRGIAPTEHFSPKGSVAEKLVWPSRVAVRSDMPGFQLTDLIVTPPAAILLLPAPGEPCHCGSGRKYKDCHGRQTRKGPR